MKRRDLKLIFSSNAPWSNSGYGSFTKDFAPRIVKDGWPLRLIAWAGLAGGSIDWQGIYCYPQMADPFGADALLNHGRHFGADVYFTMQDVFTLDPAILSQITRFIPYTPIDKEPVPDNVLDRLRYAYRIITFSHFGQKALEKKGFASTLIPEGVDMNIFKPLDKKKKRLEMKIPEDKFVVGMIGANKPDGIPRKGWQQALDAFALFNNKHPDSVFFYESNQPGGFDVMQYANHLGILPAVMTINPYNAIYHTTPDVVNTLLNCFDVTLHPSATEGFGLVIIESQAAGTPVIVNNTTSMPELIVDGKTGSLAQPQDSGMWTPGGGYIYFATPRSIYDQLEYWYDKIHREENKVTTDCHNFIDEHFNIDKIVDKMWITYIEKLQMELLGEGVKK